MTLLLCVCVSTVESHLASNVHKSRLVQNDLQVAKKLQEEEDKRAKIQIQKQNTDMWVSPLEQKQKHTHTQTLCCRRPWRPQQHPSIFLCLICVCVRSWAAGECGCSLVSVLVTHTHTQTQLLAEKSHPREEARCYDTDSHKPSHLPEDQANDLQANFTGCGEDATPSCYSRSTPAGVKNRWQKLSGSVYEQSESFQSSPPGTTVEFLNKIHVIKMWSETWSEHTTSLKTCLTDGEPDSVFLLIINENISS